MLRAIQLIKTIERAKREGCTSDLLRSTLASSQIQGYMLRPARYQTIDGATEIGWGMALLCFGLSSYIYVVLPMASLWTGGIAWLLFICAALAPYCVQKAAKTFITWPRTGYVAYRFAGKSFWIALVVSLAVVSMSITCLSLSSMRHDHSISHGVMSSTQKAVLVCLGVPNALFYLLVSAGSISKQRWKWLLFILMLLGPLGLVLIVPGNFVEVSRPVLLLGGLGFLSSGGATLFSYLRQNKPPVPEAK